MRHSTAVSTRTLALLGALGPLLFTASWIVSGTLQDDYDPGREYISALASLTAQVPWLVAGGMVAGGISLVALAAALRRVGTGRRAGTWALAGAGAAMVAAGVLRHDCSTALAACAAAGPSWHAVAHDGLSMLVFVLLVAAPLLLRLDRGVAAAGLLLLLVVGAEPAPELAGLVQRVFVTIMLGWTAVLGLRALGWTPARASERIAA